MERLSYQKLGNDTISIDLHNGFSIIAIELFNHDTKKYDVSLYMKNNAVNLLDLMERYEKLEFEADYKTIKSAILKTVSSLLLENEFHDYIERYEYMMKCFNRGNEIFEEERLNATRE